jgi:toxin secretion/phage lysis holin
MTELLFWLLIVTIADIIVGTVSALINGVFKSKRFQQGLLTHGTVIIAIAWVYFDVSKGLPAQFTDILSTLTLGLIVYMLSSIAETLAENGLNVFKILKIKNPNKGDDTNV